MFFNLSFKIYETNAKNKLNPIECECLTRLKSRGSLKSLTGEYTEYLLYEMRKGIE